MMDFDLARLNMVDSQIRPNRVTDERVLAAMGALPREAFVPKDCQEIAYVDEALPLGEGRYLMEPMVMARLFQTAEPKSGDLALSIGCGTGYGAAVLSHAVGTVVCVESDPGMVQHATQTLADLGIDTVAVVEGDMENGFPDQAPYDVIVFDGAVPDIPDAISRQLADGGRLVAVVTGKATGKAVLMTRHGDAFSLRETFDAGTPPLVGFDRPKTFIF